MAGVVIIAAIKEAKWKSDQNTAISISDYKAGKVFDKEKLNVVNNGVYILQIKPCDGVYILKLKRNLVKAVR